MLIVPRQRRRRRPWLNLLALLPASCTSASTDYRGRLCNSTLSSANATGTTSFDPHFVTAQLPNGTFNTTADSPLPDPSWLVTVADGGEAPLTEFWLDTAGQDYWEDVRTQFDACAFIIRGEIPFATMKRAEDDPGDCTSMLSGSCRSALKDQADLFAREALSAAGSITNRTAVISQICTTISQKLAYDASSGRYFPQACAQDFGYDQGWRGPTNTALALTGRYANETTLDTSCPLSGPIGKKYYNLAGFTNPSNYDSATRTVTPILTVFFSSPHADPAAQDFNSPSQLTCLRITSFAPGSEVSPPLSSSYPYAPPPPGSPAARGQGGGLSLGAVLALTLSCIFLVGFLIAFAEIHKWWRTNWRRVEIVDQRIQTGYRIERIRARAQAEGPAAKRKELEEVELEEREPEERPPEEVDGAQILELPSAPGPFELDATERRPSFVSSRRSLESFNTCDSIAVSTTEDSPVSPVERQ